VLILRKLKLNSYDSEEYDFTETTLKSIETSWQFGQVMQKQSDFLKNLQLFPKYKVNEEICDLIQGYFEMINFNTNDRKAISAAATGVCSWVINISACNQVEQIFRPNKQTAGTALAQLAKAQRELILFFKKLSEKKGVLGGHHTTIKQKTEATPKKLHDAESLIDELQIEKTGWEQQAEMLNDSFIKSSGNAKEGAAFKSYCVMFNHTFR
jgi:hypothetical protein